MPTFLKVFHLWMAWLQLSLYNSFDFTHELNSFTGSSSSLRTSITIARSSVGVYCFRLWSYCLNSRAIIWTLELFWMTSEVLFVIKWVLFVNESRARGRVCGLLSIPRQGFNRRSGLVLLWELWNILCNVREYCVKTKEYCEQNEALTTWMYLLSNV